jgi:hypothetical protein
MIAVAVVTVKLEGIENVRKFFNEKRKEVIDGGERVIKRHMKKIETSAKSKIRNISGETADSIKAEVDGKGKDFVVAKVGTLGGTKEEAIRANSLEYGHASPGKGKDSGTRHPVKTTPEHPFIRPAIDEDKNSFKADMKTEIQKVIEKGR